MQPFLPALVAALIFAIPALPQTTAALAQIQQARRALERSQTPAPDPQIEAAARRRAAAYEAHQFEVRLAEFARVWNDFVKEYSEKGTYNLKKAKSLSREMRKLQAQLPE